MLAAVLTMTVVFILSGTAILDLTRLVSIEQQQVTLALKNQIAIESTLNQAAWAYNNTDIPLERVDYGAVQVRVDSSSNSMIASIERYNESREATVTLRQTTPFDYTLATRNGIEYNGSQVILDDEPREFDELPIADLNYLYANAVEVHRQSFHTFKNLNLKDGIHIFTGHFITLKDIEVEGTLVFLGRGVNFTGDLVVNAVPVSRSAAESENDDSPGNSWKSNWRSRWQRGWDEEEDDNEYYDDWNDDEDDAQNGGLVSDSEEITMPALVFTHPRENVSFYRVREKDRIEIQGPVVVAGRLTIYAGEFTGPIIADHIHFRKNFDFRKASRAFRGKWALGFGEKRDYHWPSRTEDFRLRVRSFNQSR